MFSSAASSSTPASKQQQQCSTALLDKLGKVLPKGYKFTINHLSTPPTRTDALYSPPPDARPDRTYRESHFLAISIDATSKVNQVLVLGIEVYVFTTAWSTTIFVSKADSTGYLSLLDLPKGAPSPIREISSAFVSYLVQERRRNNVQTVVSLFARAQNQYLFPGSVENPHKHVLDDRGLVKWWCRVLNSVMEGQGTHEDTIFRPSDKRGDWEQMKGYLVVPGVDAYELRAFLPRTPTTPSNWVLGHPLERISHFAREYDWVPPRCLVPKFPDDPKSRFRDELDLEASKSAKYEEQGLWRNIETMEQFWDMMAYRQECSSGHMTGFIWVVLEPYGWAQQNEITVTSPTDTSSTPSSSFDTTRVSQPSTPPKRRGVLTASTTPKTSPLKTVATPGSTQLTPTKQSPSKGVSGAKVAPAAIAINNMTNLVRKKQRPAGVPIATEADVEHSSGPVSAAAATQLDVTVLTPRRKLPNEARGPAPTPPSTADTEPGLRATANVLVPRKKRKEPTPEDSSQGDGSSAPAKNDGAKLSSEAPAANVLAGDSVRKRAKTS
ncbi:hypothetical protein SLS53_004986 [Cytospora paraplurivora]|uniref:histone acetyltransferase n=1 Tax=Cytospora paraplurivora TaxID=2898453 RepID=A0AAN9UER8_9PEZI